MNQAVSKSKSKTPKAVLIALNKIKLEDSEE